MKASNGSLRDQAQDSKRRPLLRQQASLGLEQETPATDRWRKVADDWLAVFAVWTLGFYGVGWGFIVLAGTGPGAALMVLLKAVAIAISLTLVGTRITALVARLARRWQRRQR